MNVRAALVLLLMASFAVLFPVPAYAQTANKQVADEITAIVKAQWAAENKKNTAEALKNVADEYTEFNSDFATRLDGKALAVRLGEAGNKASVQTLASEMANEKVQVYGDVAILTYNYVGMSMDKDGKTEPARAKSTRIYVKQGGKWMLVHANFGADPLPK
ncbi:MAG TPA: nuclear transport factor 2 family protein [Thermoanaerobaculia bacterium]|jgi:ketosteroid isomerase-like protein